MLSYEYFYTSQNQVGRVVDHDNDVTWEYFYDMAGRLTDVESDDGKKIEYSYDSKGNPGTFIVKDGTATLTDIGYSYDSQNRPSAVTVNSMTGQPSQSYVYDSLGRIVSYENTTDSTNPQNKITRSFSYLTSSGLQTNRIGSVSYANTSDDLYLNYSYEYDDNGNITSVEGANLEIYYVYDSLNRLVTEDSSVTNKRVNYTYDKNGDILSKTEYDYITGETETITYQYGDADCPNGLTSYNGETVTYDANGNPLTYRGYTMSWEKGRQLASMSKGGITTTFKYDASGLRTEKTSGNTTTEYTYVGEKLVSMKSGSTILNFSYGADGSPYSFTYNGTPYFYLLNLQGDVIGIYDISGNIVARYTYDAWGKLITFHASNSSIGLSNPLRYRGYFYDDDTKMYYLQSRYYDPETGRFINADSLLVAGDYLQGTNMFAYCLNNPVMYSDPSGYNSEELYEFLASFAMLCGLANVGFTWWEPIINSDFSYEVIYGITEDVGNTLNWFYEIYDYEVNIENSRRLMNKITDMCTAIGQEIGVSAINVMSTYFTADKIGLLFDLHSDKFYEKIIFLSASLTGSLAALGIASITSGGAATIGALILSGIEAAAGSAVLGFSVAELATWIEILSLENHKS